METETALETVRRVLRDHAPTWSARLQGQVRFTFSRLVKKHGPYLDGVSNSRNFRGLVAPFVRYERGAGTLDHLAKPVAVLDEARLRLDCDLEAASMVDRWAAKIAEKIADLDSIEASKFTGTRYSIVGRRAGRAVMIDQDTAVNISARGTLYSTFPTKIYVDGEFVSAAKYKTMFGETVDPAADVVRAAVC